MVFVRKAMMEVRGMFLASAFRTLCYGFSGSPSCYCLSLLMILMNSLFFSSNFSSSTAMSIFFLDKPVKLG